VVRSLRGWIVEPYHLRRKEKALDDPEAMRRVLRAVKHVTLALCRDGEPYLVTMNHGYDEAEGCLYFHCAPSGKKLDFLRANPRVWGQALEDLGYLDGECDHAYRTVQFSGAAEFIEDYEQKRRALEVMIDQLEPDPGPVKERTLEPPRVRGVGILRVRILSMSGKEGPVKR
jgi:hypothetical protein